MTDLTVRSALRTFSLFVFALLLSASTNLWAQGEIAGICICTYDRHLINDDDVLYRWSDILTASRATFGQSYKAPPMAVWSYPTLPQCQGTQAGFSTISNVNARCMTYCSVTHHSAMLYELFRAGHVTPLEPAYNGSNGITFQTACVPGFRLPNGVKGPSDFTLGLYYDLIREHGNQLQRQTLPKPVSNTYRVRIPIKRFYHFALPADMEWLTLNIPKNEHFPEFLKNFLDTMSKTQNELLAFSMLTALLGAFAGAALLF